MSEHIFGIHDYSDQWHRLVSEAGKTAWCVHTEAVGLDVNDHSGKTYPVGVTNIVRLNNGYGKGTGVIPVPSRYADFAQRCAQFVAASRNVHYVVIGNEIALEWEQPDDNPIRLVDYMTCYALCYNMIKAVDPNIKIAPQAPAPWNNRTPDAQDWILQLKQQLEMCQGRVDWIALHAYTKGYGKDKFENNPTMDPPYEKRKFGWEALYEYLQVIPFNLRHLPCIITECNGDGPWHEDQDGWIQHLYWWIDNHNKVRFDLPTILGACLFRWAPHDDRWDMSRHGNAIEDFRMALRWDYRHNWTPAPAPDIEPKLGPIQKRVTAEAGLNLRDAPGGNVIRLLPVGTVVEVVSQHDDWLLVAIDGQRGFVFGEYVG